MSFFSTLKSSTIESSNLQLALFDKVVFLSCEIYKFFFWFKHHLGIVYCITRIHTAIHTHVRLIHVLSSTMLAVLLIISFVVNLSMLTIMLILMVMVAIVIVVIVMVIRIAKSIVYISKFLLNFLRIG